MAYEQTDPNAIPPEVEEALNRWRQQKLAEQIAGAQSDTGMPRTRGQGITALGQGFVDMMAGFQRQKEAAAQQDAMSKISSLNTSMPGMPWPTAGGSSFSGTDMSGLSPTGGPGLAAGSQLPGALRSQSPGGSFTAGLAGDLDYARKVGVDPALVAGIALREGPGTFNAGKYGNADPSLSGQAGTSYGEFQMRTPGLGSSFERDTGMKVSDPANRQAVARYAIDFMAKHPNQIPGTWMSVGNAGGLNSIRNIGSAYLAKHGPSSYGVPAGQVAGPGIPSNVEPTTPEGRLAALTAARGGGAPPPMPPPRPVEPQVMEGRAVAAPSPVAIAPQPMGGETPSSANPALSPVPMGPPRGLTPPGGGDRGAVAGPPPSAAPTVAPLAPTPSPMVAPPAPVARAPIPAPGAGGSAYDPRTGRFLAPGERIPGYAPAPMSSTGGPGGGLGGLLASLFGGGGGSAQAAPAAPAIARGLAGAPQVAQLAAPRPVQAGGGAAPMAAPQPQGQPGGGDLQTAYMQAHQRTQQLQQNALRSFGTPAQQIYQRMAEQSQQQENMIYQEGLKRADSERNRKQFETATDPVTGDVHYIDPITGKNLGIQFKGDKKQNPTGEIVTLPDKSEIIVDPTTKQKIRDFAPAPAEKPETPEIKNIPDAMGNEVPVVVNKQTGTYKPLAPEGGTAGAAGAAAPTGGAGGGDEEGVEVAPKEGVISGTTQPETPALSKEKQARLDSLNAPQGYKNRLASILRGEQTPPSTRGESKKASALMNNLQFVDPDFNAAQAHGQVQARKSFGPGGNDGKQILAANAVLDHIATAMDASEELNKDWGGSFAKSLYKMTGIEMPVLGQESALTTAGILAGGEETKYITGASGGGGQAERSENAKLLGDIHAPPSQRENAARIMTQDALQKLMEMQGRWHSAHQGQNVPDYPILSKEAVDNAKKLGFSDWFDKDNNLVGAGRGVPKTGTAETYAPGTEVVPGSSVGQTPINNPKMFRNEQDSRAPYVIGGTALGAGLTGGALVGLPALAAGLSGGVGRAAASPVIGGVVKHAGGEIAKGLAKKAVGETAKYYGMHEFLKQLGL